MSKKVKIYTSPICPNCEMAKKFLDKKNIDYEEIDVFNDKEKAKEMMEKSGQKRVPVIEIEGEVFPGFDKKKIEEALEK
ncbi:MAG: glutaredoxin family protein [Minisyncoccales bacterium]